jgi:biotin carboxyl carrier protein
MYQVKVNEQHSYDIGGDSNGPTVNSTPSKADVIQLGPSIWHVINNLKSYNVEVVTFNHTEKTAEIKVNNNIYKLTAKDQFDVLLEKLGLSNLNSVKLSEVKAPMPGMVLKVFVTDQMVISKGDNLFVLEAMKMENIIKAPADAVIKSVKIKAGDKVEKGQVLLLL